MNVIARPALEAWKKLHPAAAAALTLWYTVASKAKWQNPEEVRQYDPTVSVLKDGRTVFNIVGNRYRLVVRINYQKQAIFLRWFGTHQEYDKIDANTV